MRADCMMARALGWLYTVSGQAMLMRSLTTLSCRYQVGESLPKGQPALPWQSGQHASSTGPSMPLSKDDFVAAIVTDEWHEDMAHAGRAWRQVSAIFKTPNTAI